MDLQKQRFFDVLGAVQRAQERAWVRFRQDLRGRIYNLATLTCVAPFIGFLYTCYGIVDSFPGFGTDKATALGVVTGRLSLACVSTLIGLAVGLQCRWSYSYLSTGAEQLVLEMQNSSVDLVNQLSRHPELLFRGPELSSRP